VTPYDFIETSLVSYLQTKIAEKNLDVEVIPFPEIGDNWTFDHPKGSIVVNVADESPKDELVYGQNFDIVIEISFYSRKYNGKEGIRNLAWTTYPLVRNFPLPIDPDDKVAQRDSLRWIDSFRPPLDESESQEFNLKIHKYIIPVIYG
jgi:hypothetical protein